MYSSRWTGIRPAQSTPVPAQRSRTRLRRAGSPAGPSGQPRWRSPPVARSCSAGAVRASRLATCSTSICGPCAKGARPATSDPLTSRTEWVLDGQPHGWPARAERWTAAGVDARQQLRPYASSARAGDVDTRLFGSRRSETVVGVASADRPAMGAGPPARPSARTAKVSRDPTSVPRRERHGHSRHASSHDRVMRPRTRARRSARVQRSSSRTGPTARRPRKRAAPGSPWAIDLAVAQQQQAGGGGQGRSRRDTLT